MTNNEWTRQELSLLEKLTSPAKIQEFIDTFSYNDEKVCRSPRYVMQRRKATCTEGAIFAAAALSHLSYLPLILDLKAEEGKDDDHVIALFRMNDCWGAVAMSNFTGLRFREPVYQSLRELTMSYFDFYFHSETRYKTLREFSEPLDLRKFDRLNWRTTEKDLEMIGDHLDKMPHYKILTPAMVSSLSLVSKKVKGAGLIGSNPNGLFKIK